MRNPIVIILITIFFSCATYTKKNENTTINLILKDKCFYECLVNKNCNCQVFTNNSNIEERPAPACDFSKCPIGSFSFKKPTKLKEWKIKLPKKKDIDIKLLNEKYEVIGKTTLNENHDGENEYTFSSNMKISPNNSYLLKIQDIVSKKEILLEVSGLINK